MPSIKPFRHTPSADPVLRQVQDALRETLHPVTSSQLLNGSVLQNVALAVGNNQISHGLGRNYVSYFLGRQRPVLAFANITEVVPAANATPATTLVLNATSACSIDILVI